MNKTGLTSKMPAIFALIILIFAGGMRSHAAADTTMEELQRKIADMALLKLIYLAYTNIQKKWTHPLQNWSITISQLSIWFEGRIKLSI